MNLDELDRESILLLYESGELPEEKRVAVEHMLEHDAALRQELEALEAAHGTVAGAFSRADAGQPMPASELAAMSRKTIREIRRWQTEQALRPSPAPAPPAWRLDWRAYSVATAAAIVMAVGLFVLFGGSEEDGLNSVDDINRTRALEESEDNPVYESFALAMERTMLPPAWRAGDIEQAEDAMAQLRQITEISRGGNPDSEMQ